MWPLFVWSSLGVLPKIRLHFGRLLIWHFLFFVVLLYLLKKYGVNCKVSAERSNGNYPQIEVFPYFSHHFN